MVLENARRQSISSCFAFENRVFPFFLLSFLSLFSQRNEREKEREGIASRIDLANSKQPILRFECTAVLRAQIPLLVRV